jgi:hypothetical protein
MQLDKGVEHTGQGGLISQLTHQCSHSGFGFRRGLSDGHAFQAIAPSGRDATLDANSVRRRTIKPSTTRRQHSFHAASVARNPEA